MSTTKARWNQGDLFKLWITAMSTPRRSRDYGYNWAVYYRAQDEVERRFGAYKKQKRRQRLLAYYDKLQRMLQVKRLTQARQEREAFYKRVDEDLIEGLRPFHTPKRTYGGRFYPKK